MREEKRNYLVKETQVEQSLQLRALSRVGKSFYWIQEKELLGWGTQKHEFNTGLAKPERESIDPAENIETVDPTYKGLTKKTVS